MNSTPIFFAPMQIKKTEMSQKHKVLDNLQPQTPLLEAPKGKFFLQVQILNIMIWKTEPVGNHQEIKLFQGQECSKSHHFSANNITLQIPCLVLSEVCSRAFINKVSTCSSTPHKNLFSLPTGSNQLVQITHFLSIQQCTLHNPPMFPHTQTQC